MKTDIQIAQEAKLMPIKEVAASIGILEDEIIPDFYKLGLSKKVPELKEKVVGNHHDLDKYKVDFVFDVLSSKIDEKQKDSDNEMELEIGD